MPETREAILELRGVSKTFKDFWLRPRVKAVQELDLSVRRGEVIGLLGPNGSGKTTTIKMILGLLHPTTGQIAVLGKRPSDVKLKNRIGYLPEESHLYRFLNAEETLDFYARLFHIGRHERKGRIESLLDMVGLTAARFRPTGEYSKGMQRRVGLAQALINDPDLLILDEPTTGMDPIATRQIKDLILTLKQRGKTIILCTHLLGEVEDVCDRLIIMYGGKIRAQGTVDELLRVETRHALEIQGGTPISEQTIEKINALLEAEEHRRVEGISIPRQKLETLFLDVINTATAAGDLTTGAGVGGDVAGFLSAERAEGEDLLAHLTKPTVEPAPEPATMTGVAVPAADQPDESVLEAMSSEPRREPEPADAPPTELQETPDDARPRPAPPQPDPAQAARPRQGDADDAFLSDLTGDKR